MNFQTVLGETLAKNENTVVFSPVEVTLAVALLCANAVRGGLPANSETSFTAYWAAIADAKN